MTIRLFLLRLLALCAALTSLQARAALSEACGPAVLGPLGRALKVAHFTPNPAADGSDPAGVIVATSCKRVPDDPKLTLAAVAWDAHAQDSKALAVAVVDESAASVVALLKDEIGEDSVTQVNNGSLGLDTAPYTLAPGVRAFGLDVFHSDGSCGDGGSGPSRTLYVRDGKTLRAVLTDLTMSEYRYVRGNQPRCVSDPKEAETAILEDFNLTIALGQPGKDGWRDLALTATSKRSDHKPGRKPLHVTVPYDGQAYPLDAFNKAWQHWRQ